MNTLVFFPTKDFVRIHSFFAILTSIFWSIYYIFAQKIDFNDLIFGFLMIACFEIASLVTLKRVGIGKPIKLTQAAFFISAGLIGRTSLATTLVLVLYFATQWDSKMVWIPFLLCLASISIGEKKILIKYFKNIKKYELKEKFN